MEAPEKIYLFENPISNEPDYRWLSKKSSDDDIEYIRKDVFVEKVLNFFENDLCCYIKAQNFTIEHRRLEENFKKYMEE